MLGKGDDKNFIYKAQVNDLSFNFTSHEKTSPIPVLKVPHSCSKKQFICPLSFSFLFFMKLMGRTEEFYHWYFDFMLFLVEIQCMKSKKL